MQHPPTAPDDVEPPLLSSTAADEPSQPAAPAERADRSPPRQTEPTKSRKKPTEPTEPTEPRAADDEWDDWDDDDDDDASPPTTRGAADADAPLTPASLGFDVALEQTARQVAGTTSIGGDALGSGLNAALKCTHCGHRVFRFAGARWSAEVDYYWVRNYAPYGDSRDAHRADDLLKLSARLEASGAYAAYACGCSWQSVSDVAKELVASGVSAAPEGGARLPGSPSDALVWVAVDS